jgi:hypothetical protein
MAPNTRTIIREATEAAARLAAIREHLTDAIDQLLDAQPGYPTATGGGGAPQLNDAGKPAGLEKYILTPDPAAGDLTTLARSITTINDQLRAVHHLTAKWTAGPQDYDTTAPKLGDCVCCSKMPTATDRLRSGLCMACYQDLRRYRSTHTGDRGDWMLERRRNLFNEQEDVA